jgi:hypothetical protein
LYINPHKLNKANWDCLADAVRWAKENESVMVDVHWAGGDPAKGEVYGFASWSPKKAILCLRNPSNVEKTFEVNVNKVFELPENIKNEYNFNNARTDKAGGKAKQTATGGLLKLTLQPFEVVVMDAFPIK